LVGAGVTFDATCAENKEAMMTDFSCIAVDGWIIVKGSTIRPDTPFDGKGEQLKPFAEQCQDDEEAGITHYAEDYNNWGCCLALDGDKVASCRQFGLGLHAKHRATDTTQQAETMLALKTNLANWEPRGYRGPGAEKGKRDMAGSGSGGKKQIHE
jgi:hypothetical protein